MMNKGHDVFLFYFWKNTLFSALAGKLNMVFDQQALIKTALTKGYCSKRQLYTKPHERKT